MLHRKQAKPLKLGREGSGKNAKETPEWKVPAAHRGRELEIPTVPAA